MGGVTPFERCFGYRRQSGPHPPLRLGFLLSGGGRTLENLAGYLSEHPGLAEVVLVISDRKKAFGLERAARLGIPSRVLPCRSEEDSRAIFRALDDTGAELALLGGFLRLLTVPPTWEQRVLNIHPSLIPKYCGQGYYGDRVHQAVLDADERESGCTVHFVDNIYDHGSVLLQEKVAVQPDDTVDNLAGRVFEAECRAFPRAVHLVATGSVRWEDGKPSTTEQP